MADLDYKSTHTGSQLDAALQKALNPDTAPTAGSNALITSGGVKNALNTVNQQIQQLDSSVDELALEINGNSKTIITPTWTSGQISPSGVFSSVSETNRYTSNWIDLSTFDKIVFSKCSPANHNNFAYLYFYKVLNDESSFVGFNNSTINATNTSLERTITKATILNDGGYGGVDIKSSKYVRIVFIDGTDKDYTQQCTSRLKLTLGEDTEGIKDKVEELETYKADKTELAAFETKSNAEQTYAKKTDLPNIGEFSTSSSDEEMAGVSDNYSESGSGEVYWSLGSYGIKSKAFYKGNKQINPLPFIIVDCNGNGDYTTIEDALANANDSQTNHVTILVKSGTYYPAPKKNGVAPYEEGYRNISLIGENRDTCILRGNCGYYYYQVNTDYAILRLNGNVLIKNFTIINTSENYESVATQNGWDLSSPHCRAYCWHVDGNRRSGDVCAMENCKLYNDHFSAVGWGLRPNSVVRLKDVEVVTEVSSETNEKSGFSVYGAIYGHLAAGLSTALNQRLEVIDCIINNKTHERALYQMDGSGASDYANISSSLLFVRNILKSTNMENVYRNSLPNVCVIDEMSFGNNVSSMNKL